MAESKLVLMKTRRPPNWQEWNQIRNGEKEMKTHVAMTQTEARSILEAVTGAETAEQACELLKALTPDRKHLTYWLGQIGRRQDAGLGKNLDFRRYLNAIVENLRSREKEVVIISRDRDGNSKRKKITKPLSAATRDGQRPNTDKDLKEQEETTNSMDTQNTGGVDNDDQLKPTFLPSAGNTGDAHCEDSTPVPSTPHVSRVQDYALRTSLVFADCAVQKDWAGVFDVLARNFDNNGFLSYWLNKVGFGHLTRYGKGRDLVDYIRKVAYEVHRDMKTNIGRPVARW